MSMARRFKKSQSSASGLESNRISIPKNYGGLGMKLYEKLSANVDLILQVDLTNNTTETKGTVKGRAISLALKLQDLGITTKSVVVICSSKSADQTIVMLAALFLGAIVAPLDVNFMYKEMRKFIKKLKPALVFVDVRSCSQIERSLEDMEHKAKLIDLSNQLNQPNVIKFKDLFTRKETEDFIPFYVENVTETVAFIVSTQGTTGDPKLVSLTHQNITVQMAIYSGIFDRSIRVLTFFPLSWFFQIVNVCSIIDNDVTMIVPGVFAEKLACKYIQDFAISTVIFSCEQAVKITSSVFVKDYNMSSLNTVLLGMTHIANQTMLKMRKALPQVQFLSCYGLAETGIIAVTNSMNYKTSLKKVGSLGPLSINCQVKIVDVDTRKSLGSNSIGEICFKGDGLMLQYFKDTDRNSAAEEKSYFKTGDIGMYDDEGWFYFKGRIDDIINYDKIRIYPIPYEDIIFGHFKVKEAVLIGNKKQLVVLYSEISGKSLSENELIQYIQEKIKNEPPPTAIIKLNEFSKTSIGNIKRKELRDLYLSTKIVYVESLASFSGVSWEY